MYVRLIFAHALHIHWCKTSLPIRDYVVGPVVRHPGTRPATFPGRDTAHSRPDALLCDALFVIEEALSDPGTPHSSFP